MPRYRRKKNPNVQLVRPKYKIPTIDLAAPEPPALTLDSPELQLDLDSPGGCAFGRDQATGHCALGAYVLLAARGPQPLAGAALSEGALCMVHSFAGDTSEGRQRGISGAYAIGVCARSGYQVRASLKPAEPEMSPPMPDEAGKILNWAEQLMNPPEDLPS